LETRTCSKCGKTKQAAEFHYKVCKPCRVLATRAWQADNMKSHLRNCRNYHERNKEDRNAKAKIARQSNLERYKEYDRKSRAKRQVKIKAYMQSYHKKRRILDYGLTFEQYDAMLIAQSNQCAVCETPFSDVPHIDHDHACCPAGGKACGRCVRGLTCGDCNKGLGLFKDNLYRLTKAVAYLEKHKTIGVLATLA